MIVDTTSNLLAALIVAGVLTLLAVGLFGWWYAGRPHRPNGGAR